MDIIPGTTDEHIKTALSLLHTSKAIEFPSVLALHSDQIKSKAIGYFLAYPSRCRLKGMKRDLNLEEMRFLSLLDAAIEVANYEGMLLRSVADIKVAYYTAASK